MLYLHKSKSRGFCQKLFFSIFQNDINTFQVSILFQYWIQVLNLDRPARINLKQVKIYISILECLEIFF